MDGDDESCTIATEGMTTVARLRIRLGAEPMASGRKAGARVLHHWVGDLGCGAAGLRGLAALH